MKCKKLISVFAAFVAAVACLALSACNSTSPRRVQQLNYAESTEKINNPDQGFYRSIYVKVAEDGVSYNQNIVNASTQLYHLRIDISAFSQAVNGSSDLPLTKNALDGLDALLAFIRSSDKNAIVRFAYDPKYNGSKDKEPSLSTILNHITQVCPILDRYENTVTAIEVGLIGPWGEMHSSAIAKPENISQLAGSFLAQTEKIPVLVRTPKMIYDYLGITVNNIDDYSIAATDRAYRLGLFNDGYLGSANDLGTYTDRAREVEFLSGQTSHLPYGGEVVVPDSDLHNINVCLPEMHKLDLSYLNVEWNNQVIDKWKSSKYTKACGGDKIYYGSTAFEYIENHLGYRFVLKKSVFEHTDETLNIKLTFNNVGFGNLNRTKRAKLIFTDESGDVMLTQSVKDFTGENFDCSVGLNLASGKYEVYLCIYGEEENGTTLYALQFANNGLWNAELKANKIGEVEISG